MIKTSDKFTEISTFLLPFSARACLRDRQGEKQVGVPLYVLGMWKFGFPETLAYMTLGMRSQNRMMKFLNLASGCAMCSHHVGSTVIYAMVTLCSTSDSKFENNFRIF